MQRIDIIGINAVIYVMGKARKAKRLLRTASGKACMSLLIVAGATSLIGALEPWMLP